MKKIVIILLFLAALAFFAMRTPSLARIAEGVMESCAGAQHKTSCYEKEIPKLMDRLSLEDTFAVTAMVQDKDPQFAYCHVLAHEISFRESTKNPGGWKNVLNRCPIAMCNYGCLHGSLVQRFRGQDVLTDAQVDEVLPDLRSVCEPRDGFAPSEVDRSMCYHAIGHLAMYMSGGDPGRSLAICQKAVPDPDTREFMETCAGGVFMTVFQGIDPEDIALVAAIKPADDAIPEFCSRYGYWRQCRQEAVAQFREEVATPEGYAEFCSWAKTEKEIEGCTFVVVNDVTVRLMDRTDALRQLTQYCQGFPADRRELCFAGVAMRLVQIDPLRYVRQAHEFCAGAQSRGAGQRCFEGLVFYGAFSFPYGSEGRETYCNALDDPWKTSCIHKEGV